MTYLDKETQRTVYSFLGKAVRLGLDSKGDKVNSKKVIQLGDKLIEEIDKNIENILKK